MPLSDAPVIKPTLPKPLSDVAIRRPIPVAKPTKFPDARGLYLLVMPSGSKLWRWKYRVAGKEKLLSLGAYPEVSLKAARDARDAARLKLAQGIDPSAERQAAKQVKARAEAIAEVAATDTFGNIAREWMATQEIAEVTAMKTRWIVETFLLPDLESRPIADITPRELLAVLRTVEKSGRIETAKRARIKAGQIFRWAILEGRAETDPTASLRGALKTPKVKHHAAVTDPAEIGKLLRAIDGFMGQPATMHALKLAPLVFVRPGELRHAKWPEIDLDGAMWRIPAERMKMKAAHLVPLSVQAVAILRELKPYTGYGDYLFPSVRSAFRPMSENTVTGALRRLGYSGDEMTGHGFRSMAATRLNEMGWRADAIERQLAHAESNKVREAYTSAAQYLDERTKMMQAWADYLDKLKTGATILPMKRSANESGKR